MRKLWRCEVLSQTTRSKKLVHLICAGVFGAFLLIHAADQTTIHEKLTKHAGERKKERSANIAQQNLPVQPGKHVKFFCVRAVLRLFHAHQELTKDPQILHLPRQDVRPPALLGPRLPGLHNAADVSKCVSSGGSFPQAPAAKPSLNLTRVRDTVKL